MCKKILAGPLTPTRGKVETTDHPSIHPTGQGDPTTLDGGQLKLYNLIARRFLATLMGPRPSRTPSCPSMSAASRSPPAVMCRGGRLPRGLPVWPQARRAAARAGRGRRHRRARHQARGQASTQPPARYSQGKLVQEMEKRGLGTKSTRASIIERLYAVRHTSRTTPSSRASSASPLSTRSRSSRRASPRPT